MQLPQWHCHKIVGAAKIIAIDFGERLDLMPHGVVEVGQRWVEEKHAEVGGYYVVYEDGYASFSPAKAFLEGYSPILTEGDAAADLAGMGDKKRADRKSPPPQTEREQSVRGIGHQPAKLSVCGDHRGRA